MDYNEKTGLRFDSGTQDKASAIGGEDGFLSDIGLTGLAIACACACATVFVLFGVCLWCRSKRRRQKLLDELTFYGCEDGKFTKSAPSSRSPSPRPGKRMSCPNVMTPPPRRSSSSHMMVQSFNAEPILDSSLPPECVQPKLNPEITSGFCDPTDKKTSISNRGRILFTAIYDVISQKLNVNLIEVKDLPKRNATQEDPDPFVKMYLLPDDKSCQVSKSKKHCNSPVYNEMHTFQVPADQVKDRTLRFSVYDVDKRRVRHSLGHIVINLNNLDLDKGEIVCSDLEASVQTNTTLGDIQLSLAYIPVKEKVKIGIHKARQLQPGNNFLEKGAYVKIQLFYGHKCHRIKRTVTRQMMTNCPFDESLAFSIHGRQLESCSLVISVMITHPQEFTKHDVEYGRTVIGPFMYARGDELAHWQEMVSKPKCVSTRWHTLVSAV